MLDWIGTLVTAWLFTVVLESIMAYICRIRQKQDFLLLFLMNSITNPLAMLTYRLLEMNLPVPGLALQSVVELLVYLAEVQMIRKFMDHVGNPWTFALALNAFSYLTGLVISSFI